LREDDVEVAHVLPGPPTLGEARNAIVPVDVHVGAHVDGEQFAKEAWKIGV
jgi:hypothetical protein